MFADVAVPCGREGTSTHRVFCAGRRARISDPMSSTRVPRESEIVSEFRTGTGMRLPSLRVLFITHDPELVGHVAARLGDSGLVDSVSRVAADQPWIEDERCADLVVIDTRVTKPSPLAFRRNTRVCPETRVLLLCPRDEEVPVALGREVHAAGYLRPDDDDELAAVVVALAALSGRTD